MAQSKIYLSLARMCGEEQKYIRQAFDTHWVAPLGPNVDSFEHDLEAYLGEDKYVVALNSGTSALHLGLLLLGVQPGDYVICQSFTFVASANPVRYVGATPVFVDSELDSWNMSPTHLEKAIVACLEGDIKTKRLRDLETERRGDSARERGSEGAKDLEYKTTQESQNPKSEILHPKSEIPKLGRKPAAIIPVHLYGMPARMDKIMEIAQKYNIPVLEDAAEALGSDYQGKKCSTFGDLACLSFNGNKIITTSGGGALICSTREQAAKARFYATQARDQAPHYQHSETGYNYRMSNICAGIGRGQMTALEQFVARRREIHDFYCDKLSGIAGITFLKDPSDDFRSNHWLTCALIDPEMAGFNREDMQSAMEDSNIETRPLWKPMHLQPLFAGNSFFGNGTSEELFNKGLCLPSSPVLSWEDLNRVVEVFKSLLP